MPLSSTGDRRTTTDAAIAPAPGQAGTRACDRSRAGPGQHERLRSVTDGIVVEYNKDVSAMADSTDNQDTQAPAPAVQGDLPRRVLDNLLEGCQVISSDYRYLYVNDAVLRHGRSTRDALLGRMMMECYPGIEQTEMFATLRRCMEERSAATLENQFTFPDGSAGWFELRFEPVPEGAVILSVDITERKRAEAALRRTMCALRTLSRCNQTLVRATDEQRFMDDVCRLVVEAGEYMAAWIELESGRKGVRAEVARAEAEGSQGDMAQGKTLSFDLEVRGAPVGSLTIRLAEGDVFGSVERDLLEEIALDLGYGIETLRGRADHERTQEQLVAAQRLEAVGRLAGGVAHDFNNLLSVIMAYGEFAITQLHAGDPIREDIEQVVKAGQQAADLTRQLLAFSRKQIMEPRVTNLNGVIESIGTMLRRLLGEDIDIEVHAASDLGNVLADPGHLEQVLMNLAVNARDAMPAGGKLTIETRNVELDEEYADEHISVKPGPFVLVSIADTGVGMSSEVRSQIFEPFFTTKEKGKGTGLGLSMVYGIVKQSGGNIWVYSEPGQGTTFKIYLPRVDARGVERKQARRAVAATGHETILLVEDEPMVRNAAGRILTSAGYRVLTASSGDEALLLCEQQEDRIDLVLTDVVMPNMSGRVLAERLGKLNPSLKVLFTSGYTDNAIVHHGVLDAGTQFIGKPFSVAALTAKVRSVLDSE